MLKKRKWVLVIRGNQWILAKAALRKQKLNILRLSELHVEPEETNSVFDNGYDGGLNNSYGMTDTLSEEEKDKEKERERKKAEEIVKIKAWLKKQHAPAKKISAAISCPGVITRIITLPILKKKELDKLLTEQVDQYFTLNIADYIVDYKVLEYFEEEGQKRQRILLAAMPKFQLENILNKFTEAGFFPKSVDLAADSLTRLYAWADKMNPVKMENGETVPSADAAIIDLNSDRVEIILIEKGVFFLYSDVDVTLQELDELVIKDTTGSDASNSNEKLAKDAPADHGTISDDINGNANHLSDEISDDLLLSHNEDSGIILDQAEGSVDKALQIEQSDELIRMQMENILTPLMRNVSELLQFFATRNFGKSVDYIYLTGEYSGLPFIEEIFSNALEVRTRVGFPKSWKPRFKRKAKSYHTNWMKYGTLYGLVIRED